MASNDQSLTVSLISHTNVGKTTLTRTLLKQDVGVVADAAHVTIENKQYKFLETERGEVLYLWDTPGFGDSARLLRRLKRHVNPLGWLLNETWDRYVNRALWCSQQATRNVHEDADVVLYLVSCDEDPHQAAYIDAEMQVLEWVGKPILLLLNRVGEHNEEQDSGINEGLWRHAAKRFPIIRDVINLDAFTRCWIQEGVLLKRLRDVVPPSEQELTGKLLQAWIQQQTHTFNQAMAAISSHLANVASQKIAVSKGVTDKKAMHRLEEHLEQSFRDVTDKMIECHGLSGQAKDYIQADTDLLRLPRRQQDSKKWGLLGAALSGAATGAGADFASGGLTFGSGALVGFVVGGISAMAGTKGYNALFTSRDQNVYWQNEAMDKWAEQTIQRYIVISHFGRGRGDWNDPKCLKLWEKTVTKRLTDCKSQLHAMWETGRNSNTDPHHIQSLLVNVTIDVLEDLYPDAKPFIDKVKRGR